MASPGRSPTNFSDRRSLSSLEDSPTPITQNGPLKPVCSNRLWHRHTTNVVGGDAANVQLTLMFQHTGDHAESTVVGIDKVGDIAFHIDTDKQAVSGNIETIKNSGTGARNLGRRIMSFFRKGFGARDSSRGKRGKASATQ